MSTQLTKLQPHRTMALRGFDSLGASAALHSATPDSFIVSGTFRDAADFAVLMLWDADNFYEHPRLRYLPDFNFAQATLTFDVRFTAGLQPLDSPKSNWIDWATLDYIPTEGDAGKIQLWENCRLKSGDFTAASGTFHLATTADGLQPGDRLTLFFQNISFDYQLSADSYVEYLFYAEGNGHTHTITIQDRIYSHTESDPNGESSDTQALALVSLVNAGAGDPDVIASIGSSKNAVRLTARSDNPVNVSASNNIAHTLGPASLNQAALSLARQINMADWWTAYPTHALRATAMNNTVTVKAARYGRVSTSGTAVTLTWGAPFTGMLPGDTLTINNALCTVASVLTSTTLVLQTSAGDLSNAQYVADCGGVDGNMIELYSLSSSNSLTTEAAVRLTGGNSDVTWTCTINFDRFPSLRRCWFTYAAALANGTAFTDVEWSATYTNWKFTGPAAATDLFVAGPGSVRIEENSSACKYTGAWSVPAPESGFFSQGLARRAGLKNSVEYDFYAAGTGKTHWITVNGLTYTHTETDPAGESSATQASALVALVNAGTGDPNVVASIGSVPYAVLLTFRHGTSPFTSATGYGTSSFISDETLSVRYSCFAVHDLYLGTSLYVNSADIWISLDGGPEFEFSLYLNTGTDPAVNTRRPILRSVPEGTHTVHFRLKSVGYFYFDFLEAVIPSDVPAAPAPRPDISPALDYSTDHSWKLPPTRILWILDNLGFTGPMNQYIGVFWWNQRTNPTAKFAAAHVTFPATPAGTVLTLDLSGTKMQKSVLPADTIDTIAAHFARYINSTFVGVWASALYATLTVTTRSPAYDFTFTAGSLPVTGSLTSADSSYGTWMVDPSQSPALNRGARDWHADLYREAKLRNREITTAGSMELVNPPNGFAACYPNGLPVITDVGFGNLKSTHCAQSSPMRTYQQAVFDCIADLQHDAGLIPDFQLGEYLWWFFTENSKEPSGMAYYDAETAAAAQTALGRPLHKFVTPSDDPLVNGGTDAVFLRNRLRDHVSAIIAHVRSRYPDAIAEVLFAYDVNYPTPNVDNDGPLGGPLNCFINFPVEWGSYSTAGFDRLKVEALAFTSRFRNLNLARAAIEYGLNKDWPRERVRYLAPIFKHSSPWQKEVALALGLRIPVVNLWAFDQLNIFGLKIGRYYNQSRSKKMG